jgi:hypothetical protein
VCAELTGVLEDDDKKEGEDDNKGEGEEEKEDATALLFVEPVDDDGDDAVDIPFVGVDPGLLGIRFAKSFKNNGLTPSFFCLSLSKLDLVAVLGEFVEVFVALEELVEEDALSFGFVGMVVLEELEEPVVLFEEVVEELAMIDKPAISEEQEKSTDCF